MFKLSRLITLFLSLVLVSTLILPLPVAADELTNKERKFVEDTRSTLEYIRECALNLFEAVDMTNLNRLEGGKTPCRDWVTSKIDPANEKLAQAQQLLDDALIPDKFSEFIGESYQVTTYMASVEALTDDFARYMYEVACPSKDTGTPEDYYWKQQPVGKSINVLIMEINRAQEKLTAITAKLTKERGGISADNVIEKAVDDSIGFCFIATAAYGSESAEEINILREFRDEYLLESPLGRLLVGTYYRVSPPIASIIENNRLLRLIVREVLIDPVVNMVELTDPLWN